MAPTILRERGSSDDEEAESAASPRRRRNRRCRAMLAMSAAYADTSVLGYGGPGNVLNPTGQPIDLQRDLDGLSQLDDVTRTPTGLLYPLPYAYPAMTQSKSDPDIWTTGWIEGGLLGTFGQRINSAAFSEYTDWSNGPIVTSLGFLTENRKTAWYLSGLAENVGRDEYYQLKTGRYGVFNVTASSRLHSPCLFDGSQKPMEWRRHQRPDIARRARAGLFDGGPGRQRIGDGCAHRIESDAREGRPLAELYAVGRY